MIFSLIEKCHVLLNPETGWGGEGRGDSVPFQLITSKLLLYSENLEGM